MNRYYGGPSRQTPVDYVVFPGYVCHPVAGCGLHRVRKYDKTPLGSLYSNTVRRPKSILYVCPPSSVVEHFFGKEEVMGPIPMVGSIPRNARVKRALRFRVAATSNGLPRGDRNHYG